MEQAKGFNEIERNLSLALKAVSQAAYEAQAAADQLPEDRIALANFKEANRQAVHDSKLNNRVNSAIALEKWLVDSSKSNNEKMNNAFQYAGVEGRGKRYKDQLLGTNPKALEDYNWFKGPFLTALTNQIKFVEGMGATDSQKSELQKAYNTLDKLDFTPTQGKQALDKAFQTMHDITGALIDTAEPIKKGVYRKLNNLPDKIPSIMGVRVRLPNGMIGHVPSEKVDLLMKKYPGATRLENG